MFWIIPVILFSALSLAGPIMSDVEQARYTVITSDDDIEVRDYEPMIVAETEVSGEREEAISEGFRRIADYIFGNNKTQTKVSMTAPVLEETSEKIAMTAPVTQEGDGKLWRVRFSMPAEYTRETLPKPNNDKVVIRDVPKSKYLAIRFSGFPEPDILAMKENKLRSYANEHGYSITDRYRFAFYNPPWTLPFLRRNEVLVEIIDKEANKPAKESQE